MNRANCSKEEAIAKAARTGAWPEGLAAHAAECAVCRDVAQAARWMQTFARSADARGSEETALPDAQLLWRRARLGEDHAKAEALGAALEWADIALAAAIPAVVAVWVGMDWYAIEAAAARFLLSSWPQLSMFTYALASLAPAALVVAAVAVSYPLIEAE